MLLVKPNEWSKTMNITIPTANGELALPASGTGLGVLVLHAWWGLTPFVRGVCARLAEAGYVALAPDMFDGATADIIDDAEALSSAADNDAVYGRVSAALDMLSKHEAVRGGSVVAMGWSFGAAWSLMLEAPVGPVVVFYGTTDPEYVTGTGPFLGHFASNDPFEAPEQVQALESAIQATGREATFYTYPGTDHWFFENNRPEYDAEAADLAWQRTLDFLKQF